MTDRPQFRVGEKVCVLYAAAYISFTVEVIDLAGDEPLYRGTYEDGTPCTWWPESRLDYDLSPEQRDVCKRFERAVHEAYDATKHADELMKVAEGVLPGWLVKKILEGFDAKYQTLTAR